MYIDELKNEVQALLKRYAPHIHMEEDEMSGAWMFTADGDDTKAVFATPFYDQHPGVPVEIMNDEGETLARYDMQFIATENPDRDAEKIAAMVQAAWIMARTMN